MSTNIYAAKRALIALLAAELPAMQISYAVPANFELESVYGGGVRFEHTDRVAESPGVLVQEQASFSLYIRVMQRPIGPVADGDDRCAAILAEVTSILKARPVLGPYQWLGIGQGLGDYSVTDDEAISILSVQVIIGSMFKYGG